jgi:hypothetical protein
MRRRALSIRWNGGRRGWHSILVGAALTPVIVWDERVGWTFDLYLGLWVLRYITKGAR